MCILALLKHQLVPRTLCFTCYTAYNCSYTLDITSQIHSTSSELRYQRYSNGQKDHSLIDFSSPGDPVD